MQRRKRYWQAGAAGAFTVATFAAWLFFGLGGAGVTKVFDDLGFLVVVFGVSAVAVRAGRRSTGASRRGWFLLAASTSAWGAGQVAWCVYDLVLRVPVPSPSIADIGYLVSTPIALVALLSFPVSPREMASRIRLFVDGLLTTTALFLVAWMLVLGHLVAGPASLGEKALALAYPVGDALTASIALLLLSRAVAGSRSALAMVATGMAFVAVADAAFAAVTLQTSWVTGNQLDTLWIAGFCLIGIAAWTVEDRDRVDDALPSVPTTLLVYAPMGLAMIVALATGALTHGVPLGGRVAMVGLVGLLVARQVLQVLENRRLNDEVRSTADHFAALAHNGTELVMVVAPDGTVRSASPSFRTILGYEPDDLVGMMAGQLLVDEHRAELGRAIKGHEDRPKRIDVRMRHADGSTRWVDAAVRDLRNDPAVDGFAVNGRDITEARALQDELRRQAEHDPLTALPNRASLLRLLDADAGAVDGRARSLLFCDLDRFKVVNDSMGHEAGDAVLVEAARRLRSIVRPEDVVTRFGGDEFVLAVASGAEGATALAARVRETLNQPFRVGGAMLPLTVSIGIREIEPGEGGSAAVRYADAAMYAAKDAGRDRIEVFDDAMRASLDERFAIESALHGAVERGELELHYQPVFAFTPDGVEAQAAEALLRWRHPDGRLLMPGEFIELAEETGLIVPIGRWVIEEACRQIARWRDVGCGMGVAVNVSARQLREPGLADVVADALAATGVSPDQLVLEITETAVMRDPSRSISTLQALDALGVRLGIDDFGTGYSSLAYLSRFPIDVLKVDRSFVDDLPTNAAIVAAVVALARSMGVAVVAEGVETPSQLRAVRELGCDYVQGFLLSRPVPADVLVAPADVGAVAASASA